MRPACSRFVRLRRYEQMSMHQAMQGLRLSGLPWLQPPAAASAARAQPQQQGQHPPAVPADEQPAAGAQPGQPAAGAQPGQLEQPQPLQPPQQRQQKQSPSHHAAQQRQAALWLGWLFAVLVVPLLRAHFYCTESEAYRQQVFYYRCCTAAFLTWCLSCSQAGQASRGVRGVHIKLSNIVVA